MNAMSFEGEGNLYIYIFNTPPSLLCLVDPPFRVSCECINCTA